MTRKPRLIFEIAITLKGSAMDYDLICEKHQQGRTE